MVYKFLGENLSKNIVDKNINFVPHNAHTCIIWQDDTVKEPPAWSWITE